MKKLENTDLVAVTRIYHYYDVNRKYKTRTLSTYIQVGVLHHLFQYRSIRHNFLFNSQIPTQLKQITKWSISKPFKLNNINSSRYRIWLPVRSIYRANFVSFEGRGSVTPVHDVVFSCSVQQREWKKKFFFHSCAGTPITCIYQCIYGCKCIEAR